MERVLQNWQLKVGHSFPLFENGKFHLSTVYFNNDCFCIILVLVGTIVKKLPRRLEVMEGENAAFCVEVDEDEMEIYWFKDRLQLKENHQTIIKSFGRTHILVFVNTSYQDSGTITFMAGRSKTSSKLRVKSKRAHTWPKGDDALFDAY